MKENRIVGQLAQYYNPFLKARSVDSLKSLKQATKTGGLW